MWNRKWRGRVRENKKIYRAINLTPNFLLVHIWIESFFDVCQFIISECCGSEMYSVKKHGLDYAGIWFDAG